MRNHIKPPKDADIAIKVKRCLAHGRYKQSLHAMERIDKRKVTFQDVLYVLEMGRREEARILTTKLSKIGSIL